MAAVSLGPAKGLEVCDGDEPAGVGQGRVAGFEPIAIVFPADYVEKVAPGEAQFLVGLGFVVVERFDDLQARARAPVRGKEGEGRKMGDWERGMDVSED